MSIEKINIILKTKSLFIKKLLFLILISHISYLSANAQRFTATPEAYEIPLNYPFKIEFEIGYADAEDFNGPQFTDFAASAPRQQYNTMIINGQSSSSVSIIYQLKAKRQGVFTIPPATITVNGKKIQSNSVTVKITAPQEYIDPYDEMMKRMEEMQRQMMQQFQQPSYSEAEIKQYLSKNLFVRVVPSKTILYQGEQSTLSYKIYTRVTCNGIMASKMPSFNGFLSEEYKLPEQQEPKLETLNGVQYQTLEVKRITLFPQKTGNISIEPMELSANIFLGYESYDYAFKSNAITLDIKPLPEKNKPATFSGAVGKFSFTAKYDKTKCKVGEPISLKVTYKGTGNFKLITPPKLVFPEEFEAYEPKIKDEYQNNGSVVEGSKTFEYIIVPQDGGKYKLPKYEFAYFDVDKADYVKFTLPETEIEVSGKAAISQNVVNFFKREKENVPKGMYGIKQQFVASNTFVGSNSFWLLTASPFLLLLIGFVFRNKEYSDSELLLLRRKKANAIALRRLATAKKLMQNKNEQAFYNEVIRALWEFLSDKLYIPQAQLSKENIAEKLTTKNVSQHKIDALNETLESCEQALFSPEIAQNKMPATFDKARELIIDFEEDLKMMKD